MICSPNRVWPHAGAGDIIVQQDLAHRAVMAPSIVVKKQVPKEGRHAECGPWEYLQPIRFDVMFDCQHRVTVPGRLARITRVPRQNAP